MRDPRIDALQTRIDTLRREYDLFLSGQRKTEPFALAKEVEEEVMGLLRSPVASTVFKFQARMLALRFRSLGTQVKNLLELKFLRRGPTSASSTTPAGQEAPAEIILDEAALRFPEEIPRKVSRLLERIGLAGQLPKGVTPEELSATMAKKAMTVVGKNGVEAVRYTIVAGSHGPRMKGEPIFASRKASNSED